MNDQFFRRDDLPDPEGGRRELVGYGEHPPRIEWAGGAKVAVQIVVNYEEGSEKTFAMGDAQNDIEGSLFRMDFRNLVTSTVLEGLPSLQNAGSTRFQGFEVASTLRGPGAWSGRTSYSFHDSTFVDFVPGFRLPCHFHERSGVVVIADLQGRVTLMDRNNAIVAHLGDATPASPPNPPRTTTDRRSVPR